MRHHQDGDRFFITLSKGEPFMETMTSFARQQDIVAAFLTAIGMLRDARVAYYDLAEKEYRETVIEGCHELVGLTGNITVWDGGPMVHAHAMLSGEDSVVRGGHLVEGVVGAAAEVFVHRFHGELVRRPDDDTGLRLVDLGLV